MSPRLTSATFFVACAGFCGPRSFRNLRLHNLIGPCGTSIPLPGISPMLFRRWDCGQAQDRRISGLRFTRLRGIGRRAKLRDPIALSPRRVRFGMLDKKQANEQDRTWIVNFVRGNAADRNGAPRKSAPHSGTSQVKAEPGSPRCQSRLTRSPRKRHPETLQATSPGYDCSGCAGGESVNLRLTRRCCRIGRRVMMGFDRRARQPLPSRLKVRLRCSTRQRTEFGVRQDQQPLRG